MDPMDQNKKLPSQSTESNELFLIGEKQKRFSPAERKLRRSLW
jgi:hypothetical protein